MDRSVEDSGAVRDHGRPGLRLLEALGPHRDPESRKQGSQRSSNPGLKSDPEAARLVAEIRRSTPPPCPLAMAEQAKKILSKI
jgi:hypothetical protein